MYNVKIEGMGCAHCITRVTNAMQAIDAEIIEISIGNVKVDYKGDRDDVKNAIEDLGFDVIAITEE
ncbi:MAG: heavy-metal-associated domain-containing protein [Clostridia bacterium]|nr:heavy-metal-associated domain-containing protein [Clostridia bacterium]